MFSFDINYPNAALEIGIGYTAAVKMQNRNGKWQLQDYNLEPLPQPRNQTDAWGEFTLDERFQDAIDRQLEWLANCKKISLILPDQATKTFFLDVEEDSKNRNELRDIILFKIQRITPISAESTAVAYQKLRDLESGGQYLALVSSKHLTRSYEKYFAQRGIQIGNIETASLAATSLLLPELEKKSGDFTLVRLDDGSFTISVYNGQQLVFVKSRICRENEEIATALPSELRTISLFIEDKLKGSPVSDHYLFGPGVDAVAEMAGNKLSGAEITPLRLEDFVELAVPIEDANTGGKLISAVATASRN
jgi:hypothetical protein